jgi:hypothetical protein
MWNSFGDKINVTDPREAAETTPIDLLLYGHKDYPHILG